MLQKKYGDMIENTQTMQDMASLPNHKQIQWLGSRTLLSVFDFNLQGFLD
jgi:hypothetical protein